MSPYRGVERRSTWPIVSGASGVLLGVSALLTWFEIEGYPLTGMDDYPTRSGTRSSPGTLLLVAGAGIVVSAVVVLVRPGRVAPAVAGVALAVLGAVAVTWGWWTIAAYLDLENDSATPRQPGLWVATVAALVALVASIVELVRRRREAASTDK